VEAAEAKGYAEERKLFYFETSALKNQGVEDAGQHVVQQILYAM
jgi:hypothetical protein